MALPSSKTRLTDIQIWIVSDDAIIFCVQGVSHTLLRVTAQKSLAAGNPHASLSKKNIKQKIWNCGIRTLYCFFQGWLFVEERGNLTSRM
jgi:hypothetical protein